MKTATSILKALRAAEQAICFVAFAVMALMLMIDVGMRELVGVGWYGASQRAVFAMVIVVFVAMGLATADGTHLRARFADTLIPKSWEAAFLRLADVITAAFYIAVAIIAAFATRVTFGLDERTTTLMWPVWPFQAVVFAAFAVSGFRQVIYVAYPALRPGDTSTERPGISATVSGRTDRERGDGL